MEQRQIGRSEIRIAPVMIGGNVFGWTADAAASFAMLDAFTEAGFNAIDTADVYSAWVPGHAGGESERVIGAWLKARGGRDRIMLATKVGENMPGWGKGLSASYLVKAVEGSLSRLGTDYIDLCQSHCDDGATPLHETLEAYERLIRAGKVRLIGASHYDAARLAESLKVSQNGGLPRYDSLQPRYNLCDRAEFEGAVQQVCVEQQVGVLCYSALAKGFLTGKFRSAQDNAGSQWQDRLNGYLNPRGLRILAALDQVALQQQATPAEVALAWLIAQPGVAAAIVAANSVEQLQELLGFTRLTLDQAQLDALRAASAAPGPQPGR